MKHLVKQVAILLAGVLATSVLLSCESKTAPLSTAATTTAQAADPPAPKEILSPEELYNLLLRTPDYTVESKLEQSYPGYEYIWEHSMEKDGDLLKTKVFEQDGAFVRQDEENYCDLKDRVYYQIERNDWFMRPHSDSFFVGELKDFLEDLLPVDSKRLCNDENYGEYEPERRQYSLNPSVLEDVFAENDWEQPPEKYYLTFSERSGNYRFTYYWKDGQVITKYETLITFCDVSVTLPVAENAEIAETPYEGEALDALLKGLAPVDLTQAKKFYTIGFSAWEDEEAERLFDGVKTYEQWYYNEDGTLKEGAFPESGEGGGPGKCAGMIDNYSQLIFRFEQRVEICAYVLTNANDNEEFGHRTPVRWCLYGTNDPKAAASDTAYDAEWILMDHVWESGMSSENFASFGFTVDPENREPFNYYCLELMAINGYQIQIGELEFYVETK